MIKAVYNTDEHSITLTGHADYAPKGSDIVCAGVSTLVYTLINSCSCDIYDETVMVRDNYGVYDAVICGLDMISKKFPKNLQLVPFRTYVLL